MWKLKAVRPECVWSLLHSDLDLLGIKWRVVFPSSLSLAWKTRFSLKTWKWRLPLWFELWEPKLVGCLLPLYKGVASSSLVFEVSLCIQQWLQWLLYCCCLFFFFFWSQFLETHVMAIVCTHCYMACFSWCGSGSSVAIYWLVKACTAAEGNGLFLLQPQPHVPIPPPALALVPEL